MILKVEALRKSFSSGEQSVDALKGIDLTVEKGEFVSIMGPSGSGKSTFLYLLGGLDSPTSGSVSIEGKKIYDLGDDDLSLFRRRRLGFIFQFFNLLPTLSAIENVCLPRLLDGEDIKTIEGEAKDLLGYMGLEKRVHHRPDQLSGGEMQRVAIARALISKPAMILADEPTGNLDSKTGEQVLKMLSQMVREKGHTLLMVTHDPKAAAVGSRLVRLKDGLIESDERQ
jgi:putative ABC transport system ATP-binding protein